MNINGYRHARQFDTDEAEAAAEDSGTAADADASAADQPDYSFEGFSVDFLDKVALLPVTPAGTAPRRAG